ncbi:GWxTD domain-containing protein [bacterium]|nr:GWxTD domain-containing protein [bacterium]
MFHSFLHGKRPWPLPSGPMVLCIGLLILVQNGLAGDKSKLFQNAKKLTVSQDWDEAIALYEQFIHESAGHKDEDDAFFWLAYCMEKRKPDDIQAFLTFDELIKKFPKSAWADDAVVHQVGMAAYFVREGKEEFRSFLREQLDHEYRPVKLQAALELGKLGDRTALPVLKELAEDPAYYKLASPLIKDIEHGSGRAVASGTTETEFQKNQVAITAPSPAEGAAADGQKKELKSWDWSGILPTFYTKRHRQYTAMLKPDEQWSLDELIMFGMWTILDTDEFETLHHLSGYDRSEWLRKYWKLLDPTPTTEKNEAFEEFKQRINYAYANFSKKWDYHQLQFKRDMYQRSGWPNAPWDARGDLYIKYGPPQFQTIEGWHTEKWTYYKYHVDFIVKQYETNIYHDAIQPGSLSLHTYKDHIGYVYANFIDNPEFRYYHEFDAEPLKLKENRFYTDEGLLKFSYSIPVKEFEYEKKDEIYWFQYHLSVVVFDEDMREVVRHEEDIVFKRENKKALKDDKLHSHQIHFKLIPGPYLITIQIEDKNSDKLGIYMKNLDTSRPPG